MTFTAHRSPPPLTSHLSRLSLPRISPLTRRPCPQRPPQHRYLPDVITVVRHHLPQHILDRLLLRRVNDSAPKLVVVEPAGEVAHLLDLLPEAANLVREGRRTGRSRRVWPALGGMLGIDDFGTGDRAQ